MRMSENTPSTRHFDAILTPSWQVPRHVCHLATFAGYESQRFADVLYLYTEKPAVKTAGGTCQNGVLMA